jgi:hypothetical protein
VDRAVAVDQLGLGVVGLAGHAVPAGVGPPLDPAVVVDALEERLDAGPVPGLGGADEVVVGDVEQLPRLAEPLAGGVGVLQRAEAALVGGALHLESVLVGAGEEEDVVAGQAVPPSQRVGRHRRVGVPDVGHVVDVVDRGGDVEARHGAKATVRQPAQRSD